MRLLLLVWILLILIVHELSRHRSERYLLLL